NAMHFSRPQIIAVPIFMPMVAPVRRISLSLATGTPLTEAPQAMPTSLAKAEESDSNVEETTTVSSDEEDESVLRSAANGSDDPESFDDVQIEWVRATSEGCPPPVERTFIQFNTHCHV
ncbi:unnamed protein product, partial [Effrenium voratum]